MPHDLVIRDGLVVDGTGADPFPGDLAIDGSTITAVGPVTARGRREIDAAGAIVTPGFVDTHTHFDAQVGWDPHLTPSSWHGVTTVLIGNCGMSFAPVRPGQREQLARMMEAVEDIPARTILSGLPWTWESYGEYLDCVESLRPALNVVGMIGHCALRYYVMGDRAVDGHPDAREIRAMADQVEDAIADGAVGFSTSRYLAHLLPNGQPVPGTFAEADEVLALAGAVGRGALFQVVIDHTKRGREMALLRRVAESSECRVFTTAAAGDQPRSGRAQRHEIEALRAAGVDLTVTMAPRPAGVCLSLDGNLLPWRTASWLDLIARSPAKRLGVLHDPATRDRLLAEAAGAAAWPAPHHLYPLGVDGQLDYMAGAEASLAALADQAGESPAATFVRLLVESRGRITFAGRLFNRNLDALADLLRSDCVLPGLGDAGAHVGQVMDAGWTTFFLGHWVRDTAAFDLADGIRRLTSGPADLLGIADRGRLVPGAAADVNVIDLAFLRARPPEYVFDFPHDAGRLVQRANGYRATLVNGEALIEDDTPTGRRGGRVLRHAAA